MLILYQLFLVSFHISNSFKRPQCFKKVALTSSQIYHYISYYLHGSQSFAAWSSTVWDLKIVLCESRVPRGARYLSLPTTLYPTYRCTIISGITFLVVFWRCTYLKILFRTEPLWHNISPCFLQRLAVYSMFGAKARFRFLSIYQ